MICIIEQWQDIILIEIVKLCDMNKKLCYQSIALKGQEQLVKGIAFATICGSK